MTDSLNQQEAEFRVMDAEGEGRVGPVQNPANRVWGTAWPCKGNCPQWSLPKGEGTSRGWFASQEVNRLGGVR